MKYLVTMALAVGLQAGIASAQDATTAVCADYAAADNAGKMAMLAELESANSEMASSQELTSAEIDEKLSTDCASNPDKLVTDAWKELHM
jgi:hypothetical protein